MITQFLMHGMNNILDRCVRVAYQHNWAKKSSRKLIDLLEKLKATLPKVFSAAASICYGGRKFRQVCYILEGNSNLVFRTEAVLSEVKLFIGNDATTLTFPRNDNNLNTAWNKSVKIINTILYPYIEGIDDAKVILGRKSTALVRASNQFESLILEQENQNNEENEIREQIGRRSIGGNRINYVALVNDNTGRERVNNCNNGLTKRINDTRGAFEKAKIERDDARDMVVTKKENLKHTKHSINFLLL